MFVFAGGQFELCSDRMLESCLFLPHILVLLRRGVMAGDKIFECRADDFL